MSKNYFYFKRNQYYIGTIVEVQSDKKELFGFNSILKFTRYDNNSGLYCFAPLHDIWTEYKMSEKQIQLYINKILNDKGINEKNGNKIEPQYIDGIVSAWTWYILIMFFALFLAGVTNKIIVWVVVTIIFFSWRRKKMNGE